VALPDVIEIKPPGGLLSAEVTVPGSKSITNRALILAALGTGRSVLQGALWSEDTQVMVDCLRRLGFAVEVELDPDETGNRVISVEGLGGKIPRGGTFNTPLELFVGNAGTAARFLTAFVCLGTGIYRLHGVPRMHDRPQAALFEALRQLGYRIDTPDDRLPAVIFGGGHRPGVCFVNTSESSQFASALSLSSKAGGWEVKLTGENAGQAAEPPPSPQPGSLLGPRETAESGGYAALTRKMMQVFPDKGGAFRIEPDASSGSYFWAAGHRELLECRERISATGLRQTSLCFGLPSVRVANWPNSGWQMDERFDQVFNRIRFGSPWFDRPGQNLPEDKQAVFQRQVELFLQHLRETSSESARLPDPDRVPAANSISRRTDLGDSIMTAITMAPLAIAPTRFTDLGRLRVQECERVLALRMELTRCGVRVAEGGDTLTIYPSQLHGAEIETYNDHRMAMCFSILGLKVPGIRIKNPACVKKTFPNFYQKLATAPPAGLGVSIFDAATQRQLQPEELFAD
jgi:3-phosphoshikimate 1-carboxyvinyltransferase